MPISCRTCKGKGRCTQCNGSGEIGNVFLKKECPTCRGQKVCLTCNGSGKE